MDRHLSARDVPELWATLVGHWQPGHAFDQLADAVGPAELDAEIHRWCCEHARLWFITADMTALVQAAAPSLPATTLTRELVPRGPAGAGLAVFAAPLTGHDSKVAGGEITVQALLWGNGAYRDGVGAAGPMVVINSYCFVAGGLADTLGTVGQLGPLGGGHWRYGTDFDDRWPPTQTDAAHASNIEDRRWLACMLLLAAQPLASDTPWRDRAQRRRWQRAGRPDPPDVRLIDVRRRPAPRTPAEGEGEGEPRKGGKHSYRYPVHGHWRQQAYGPGRTLHRPVWIDDQIRGPADAPLVIRHDVHVLRSGPDEHPEEAP